MAAGRGVDRLVERRTRHLLVGVLAVLGLIAAACGDNGNQLTTEEFFLEVGVLDTDYAAATDELEADLDQAVEAATSEEEVVQAFASSVDDSVVALEDFVNGIEELNAPDDLSEFHDRAVSTGQETIDAVNDMATALDDVTTEAGLIASFGPVEEAFERFNAICTEAQGLADDAGVDVTYDCDGDE